MADITAVSKQFVDYYYATFSANRSALQALYVRLIIPQTIKFNPDLIS